MVTSYTYDYHNRLIGVTVGGTAVATYVYDALDRRIGIQDNGTQAWVVWDLENPYEGGWLGQHAPGCSHLAMLGHSAPATRRDFQH